MSDRSKVRIPPYAAEALQADLDDAIKRRSVVEIRTFADEAEESGMDQEAARGREIADVIEAKAGRAGRDELTRLKASLDAALAPTQDQLVRKFDLEMMSRGSAFSVNDFEEDERKRVETQNAALADRDRRFEEQRARQVVRDEPTETSWWRR